MRSSYKLNRFRPLAPLAALHLCQSFSLFQRAQVRRGSEDLLFRVAALHPRLASRCTESRLQSYREGWEAGAAVYGSWRGGPSHEKPPRRCHKATGSFTIRPLVHSGGRICFAAIAPEQRRFLGCLSNQDAASRFSQIFALPEYFRSDTPGLARASDIYPNRLSQ